MVRHGVTETTGKVLPGRTAGLHLSEAGHLQATRAGRYLESAGPFAALYTSPLERAQETAAGIGDVLGLVAQVDDGLLECDFGDWTGRELAALTKEPDWSRVQRWPSGFRFPGGESFRQMQERIVAAVDRLRATHRGDRIVLVSHADPIKALIAHALGVHLDMFQRIVISPCSASFVTFTADSPIVLGVNCLDGVNGLRPS
jgi:probable phosphoglycerate mutase